jgi:putative ABC transport system substrate-binding protein
MRRRSVFVLAAGATITSAAPLRAQQARLPAVGWIGLSSREQAGGQIEAFERGLAQQGFVDGQSLRIEYRFAQGHYDRVPGLAADLVSRSVDVICTSFNAGALAAKAATSEIPIVFVFGVDPVRAGLVAALDRPGGNATGVALLGSVLEPKRLELVRDLLPGATIVGALVNPDNPNAGQHAADLQAAAAALGLQLAVLHARNIDELGSAFATLQQRGAGATLVTIDPFFFGQRKAVVELAARARIATIYPLADFVQAGGLLSYGNNLSEAAQQIGLYAGRILKGARPADLPVQQPTRFELVINRGTARALGITIPESILTRADEVIE